MFRRAVVVLFTLLVAIRFVGPARADSLLPASYSMVVLPFGSAINNSGQVVGSALTATGSVHIFTYNAGVITDLGTFGGSPGASDINDSGQIVGTVVYGSAQPTFQAFLYSDNVFTGLGHTSATGINSSGQIVGYANPPLSGFLYDQGVFRDLGTHFAPQGINDNGQVIGFTESYSGNDNLAFIYQNGLMTPLGTLGGNRSLAYAINENGHAVGGSNLSNGILHPFFYSSGTMVDMLGSAATAGQIGNAVAINSFDQAVGSYLYESGNFHLLYWDPQAGARDLNLGPDWTNLSALDINDAGQIIGSGRRGGVSQSFILSPDPNGTIRSSPISAPEPSSLLLLGLGLAVAAMKLKRATVV